MEKISFDNGVKEYRLGSGVLRFNPGDPNLYVRFAGAMDKLQGMEQELTQQAKLLEDKQDGTAAVQLMRKADLRMKELLNWVFGGSNDFDALLDGGNLLAVAGNGERVITNLLDALQPVLTRGLERCAREKTREAVAQAKARREAR